MTVIKIDGPYFEDFDVGQVFSAPSVTVTEGQTAVYQALTGDRMRLPLDRHLAHRVTGNQRAIVHANLVTCIAAGQSTYASQYVKGNLFYRGLVLRRPVFVGDSLKTTTKVVGLKQNRAKPGRAATGMVALEMDTRNQDGDQVVHLWRCPMIPCRDPAAVTGKDDDFGWIKETIDKEELIESVPTGWDLGPLTTDEIGLATAELSIGDECVIAARDTITCAPELVRVTGNIAFTHTDASRSYLGERLVYGGHTMSLALSQVTRALPNMLTVVAWQGCDHLGPVLENDLIRSCFVVNDKTAVAAGGYLYELRIDSYAARPDPDSGELKEDKVLDWRIVVWGL